jgi:hypothetical protein
MKVECAKLRRFNENHLSIKVKGKWGVVDPNNNVVTDFIYENDCRMRFSEGFAPMQKDKKWGFIDKQGKVLEIRTCKEHNKGFARCISFTRKFKTLF